MSERRCILLLWNCIDLVWAGLEGVGYRDGGAGVYIYGLKGWVGCIYRWIFDLETG